MKTRLIIAISLGAITFSSLTNILSPKIVNAYDNNNIMSDAVFDDTSTMSVSQIQSFLNGFPNSCLANYQAPYPNDYSNYGSNVSAATVIGRVSDLWHVNPRVILTTLEKEEGLVSGGSGCDSWRYNSAMGMGCPDGGACPAPGYAGFTAQVTKGTWQMQFSKYRSYGDLSWGDNGAIYYYGFMTAGVRSRVSGDTPVSYDGYATIDGTSVYMSNGATAALYTYTPHFSGNQHFVQIFNAWFGSTQVSDLVRSVNDPTVYLVSGANKYPIASMDTLGAFYPLGNISYVDQSYIDSKTTQPVLGRAVLAPSGTVNFVDAGIRLPFGSCGQVSDYGYSCASLPLLTDYQINALTSGPLMTNVYSTTSGKRFYITAGTKREVYDDQSLTNNSIPLGSNMLHEAALNNLSYGIPIIRNDVYVTDRGSASLYIYTNNALNIIDTSVKQATYFGRLSNNQIDTASINLLTKNSIPPIKGYIKATTGDSYVVTDTGKIKVTSPTDWSNTFVTLSDSVLSQIPDITTLAPPYTIKSAGTNGTIYYVTNSTLRPITSWNALLALSATPNVLTVPTYYINDIATGTPMLAPGSLVLSSNNPTVYLVDGLNNLISMGTFDPAMELGFGPIVYTSDSILNNYNKSTGSLSGAVQCGVNQGLAIGGSVYPVALTSATYTTLSAMNCSQLNWKISAPQFLLANSGTIFQIQNGQKQPIGSYGKYLSLGGNGSNTIRASNYVLNYFTDGALLN